MVFSFSMQRVASPSAPHEIPRSRLSPNFAIDKNTSVTTRTFKGIPNRFIMTDQCESGTYLLRRVPMEGKYIPTHASNAKNTATRASRLIDEETVTVAVDMAIVAMESIADANFSVGTAIFHAEDDCEWPIANATLARRLLESQQFPFP